MPIQQILPVAENEVSNIILMHRLGVIIAINESIYQVRIFKEPNRKIFSTSLDGAYNILQQEEEKTEYFEDFYYQEKNEVKRII